MWEESNLFFEDFQRIFIYLFIFIEYVKKLTSLCFSRLIYNRPTIPVDISNAYEWDSLSDESSLRGGES